MTEIRVISPQLIKMRLAMSDVEEFGSALDDFLDPKTRSREQLDLDLDSCLGLTDAINRLVQSALIVGTECRRIHSRLPGEANGNRIS
jgi:hypothetical protein